MLTDIKDLAKTETQNKKEIYKVLQMDKIPDKGKVLLAFLGHSRYAVMFKKDHPNTDIYILDNKDLTPIFNNSLFKVKLVNSVNIYEIKEALKNMKFDYIIMNPPYNGNLHLKILNEIIKYSDNIINLSPVRWLQDPLAKNKKGSDFLRFSSIKNRIASLEVISAIDAWKLFNAQFTMNLGIYTLSKEGGFDCNKFNTCQLFEKVKNYFYKENLIEFSEKNEKEVKAFVPIRCWTFPLRKTCYNAYTQDAYFINGKTPNGVYWRDSLYKGNGTNIKDDRSLIGISFNTANEAKNYYLSLKTLFIKYYIKVVFCNGTKILPKYLPWMGNQINPRTGLKGYEGEWTNEDFYQFFNLTPDEIKIIEDTMKKYK